MFVFSARPKAPYFSIGPKLAVYVRLLRAHIPCKFQKNRPSRFGVMGQKLVFQCAIQDFPHSIGSAAALAYNTSPQNAPWGHETGILCGILQRDCQKQQ